jgi:DNA polymerase-3 subunit delta'
VSFERLAPEQHDTLDGVPEPAETPRLFGHREAAGLVAAAYRDGKLPHALILAGPRGIGKATLAFHIAHHLLKHPTSNAAPAELAVPDPASPLSRQIATGAHPSILHLTRPFNEKTKTFRTVLSVDEIRRVARFLSMTSHDGSYRVVIVDPADDMNRNAANALLKNLEEPPSRTIFMLIAHSEGSLLPTIRSRCQLIRLSPLATADLAAALEGAFQPFPDDPATRQALALRSGGSVREAILLTEHGGIEIADALDTLARAAILDTLTAHKLADVVAGRGEDIRFDIFNRHALELLSDAAGALASSGRLGPAKRLSDTWHEAQKAISDAETYNLERKQHALTMIERLNAAMRM